jgi:hypothetical protein
MFMHRPAPLPTALTQPWRLPLRGLAVFHGECNAPRLSHYFMPHLTSSCHTDSLEACGWKQVGFL